MRKVLLRGTLGKLFGRVHHLEVSNPAEAVRALCANFPELREHLIASDPDRVRYRVAADRRRVEPDELHHPLGPETISITPVLAGAGDGFWQTLAGVALIGLSLIPGIGPAISFGLLSNATAIGILGGALVLGGVSRLLSPAPQTPQGMGERAEKRPSYLFDGPVNTSAQGLAVPVGYGRLIIGSAVVSGGITVEDIPA